jgi:hypothetical protein
MSLRGVLMRKGRAVVFSKEIPGAYDPATDTSTPSTTVTVSGYAMRIQGDPDEYAKLGLIQSEHPMLSFDPDTDGELPTLGMTVEFGGETLTVEDVNPCAMNGVATSAHVRCSR